MPATVAAVSEKSMDVTGVLLPEEALLDRLKPGFPIQPLSR